MNIKHIGHSYFVIKGKNAVLATDPFEKEEVGIPSQKVTADIVTVSHEHKDHNAVNQILGNPVIIRGPGEYEIKEVRIYGYRTFHDKENGAKRGKNTIYLIIIDNIRILHTGDLGHGLSDDLLDEIGDIDILMIPIGGTYTISVQEAASLTKKIEPLIVIPMHYQLIHGKEAFQKLQPVELFEKELDKKARREKKLSITRDKLPKELEIVVFEI